MAPEGSSGEQLEAVRRRMGVDVTELWVDYLGLGGTQSPSSVNDYLRGRPTLDSLQHDVLAQAINEQAMEHGMDHAAPYMRD